MISQKEESLLNLVRFTLNAAVFLLYYRSFQIYESCIETGKI